jgi:hypothetical protein
MNRGLPHPCAEVTDFLPLAEVFTYRCLRMVTDRRLLIAGALLLLGGAITLSLHAAGAPESLLDLLYDTLLSGLDVPPDPSDTATDIVNYVSLLGGIGELVAGMALLVAYRLRQRRY